MRRAGRRFTPPARTSPPHRSSSFFIVLHPDDSPHTRSPDPIPKDAAMTKDYRSKDGQWIFKFRFVPDGDHIAVYCLFHPPLNGQDPSPHKTHLYSSGKICFV